MATSDLLQESAEVPVTSCEYTKTSFAGSTTQDARILSGEEKVKLEKDRSLVCEFKQNKLEVEAQRNWDIFYKRNTTKFFKDRHWTTREFGELVNRKDEQGRPLVVFEVGCGVGNFMFPLLNEDVGMYFYACDFSKRAVQFVKDDIRFDPSRCTAFHCDITQDQLTNHVPVATVDVATMIFVLSAIHPDKMAAALKEVFQVLRPGGCLLIRDYGLYDYAMLRFAAGHKLSDNFYVRQDGTRAFYFSLDILESLMSEAGFEVSTNEYIQRQTVNKKEGLSVPRIFVQGKFVKPTVTKPTCVSGQSDCHDNNSVIECCGADNQDANSVANVHDSDSKDSNSIAKCFDSKLSLYIDENIQAGRSDLCTEDVA